MARRRILGALALVTAVTVTAAACGSDDDDAGSGDGGKPVITLGFQGPLSGDNQQLGINALNGAKTAVAEANANPDLPFTLELVESDDQGDPGVAPTAAQKLVDNPDVVGIIGPVFSGATKASEPLFSQASLLSVSPSATNPDLTGLGFSTFYRVIAPDTVQAEAVGEYIATELEAKKVFSLDDRSDYGIGLSENLEANLTEAGVTVVHDGINPTKDYTSEATKIIAEAPDVLFYSGYYAEFALLTKALKDKNFAGIIMSGDGSLDPQYIEQAGADVTEDVYLSCPCGDANTDPAAAEFVTSFGETNDGTRPGTYSGEAYDATNAIIEVMKGLGDDITRESLSGAFGDVSWQGITKLVEFEDNGEVKGSNVFIYQVKGGEITVVGNTADLLGS